MAFVDRPIGRDGHGQRWMAPAPGERFGRQRLNDRLDVSAQGWLMLLDDHALTPSGFPHLPPHGLLAVPGITGLPTSLPVDLAYGRGGDGPFRFVCSGSTDAVRQHATQVVAQRAPAWVESVTVAYTRQRARTATAARRARRAAGVTDVHPTAPERRRARNDQAVHREPFYRATVPAPAPARLRGARAAVAAR